MVDEYTLMGFLFCPSSTEPRKPHRKIIDRINIVAVYRVDFRLSSQALNTDIMERLRE